MEPKSESFIDIKSVKCKVLTCPEWSSSVLMTNLHTFNCYFKIHFHLFGLLKFEVCIHLFQLRQVLKGFVF